MVKNKHIALFLASILCLASNSIILSKSRQQSSRKTQTTTATVQQQTTETPRLSQYDFGSASVLPIFRENNTIYCILSREAGGKDKGTYDDFGGKRDPGENHPLISAAREFFEEAILELSLGLTLNAVMEYIDIANKKHSKTLYILANSRNVAYITYFGLYKDAFLANFYAARNKATSHHLREKDRLAIVEWNTLKQAISESKYNSNVMVNARELNPQTNTFETKQIKLRPYFVNKYRPFFMNKPYKEGMNKKIRFYDFVAPETKAAQDGVYPEPVEGADTQTWSTRFWNWVRSWQ